MSSPFSAVKPSAKLSDQVASALEAEIRAGRIQASDKLPTEAVLAQQFQVSRTVVREAISRLKSLGLVDSRQGSGVYVLAPGIEPLQFDVPLAASREAVMQIVEVRRALEAEVAELARADVIVRPQVLDIGAADFSQRANAIVEGEKAALAVMPQIRERVAQLQAERAKAAAQAQQKAAEVQHQACLDNRSRLQKLAGLAKLDDSCPAPK